MSAGFDAAENSHGARLKSAGPQVPFAGLFGSGSVHWLPMLPASFQPSLAVRSFTQIRTEAPSLGQLNTGSFLTPPDGVGDGVPDGVGLGGAVGVGSGVEGKP